jgi:cytochrome c
MKNLIAPFWAYNHRSLIKFRNLYAESQLLKKITMSKKLAFVLSGAILMAACGSGNDTKTAGGKDTTTTAAAPPAVSDKGLELIGASDCTTCHRLHQADGGSSIGPAYDQVAAKYSPAADTTITRLVNKIISGGSGIWGTIPMSAHSALKPDDVKTMVTYILALKK